MKKQSIVGQALDAYSDIQAQHPMASQGAMLAGSLLPGVSSVMEMPNIAQDIRHNRHWSALGRTGNAILGLVPGLGTVSRLTLPMATQLGGEYMQARQDAQNKAASLRRNIMRKQAFAPLAAAMASPLLKTMGVQATIGAGMQGLSNVMNKEPATGGMGQAAVAGGAMGAMTHGAGKLMGEAAQVPPPAPAKTAFMHNLKAAQSRLKFATINNRSTPPTVQEKQSMNRPNLVAQSLMQRMGLVRMYKQAAGENPHSDVPFGAPADSRAAKLGPPPTPDPLKAESPAGDSAGQAMLPGMEHGEGIAGHIGKMKDSLNSSSIGRASMRHGASTGMRTLGGAGIGALAGGLGGAAMGDTGAGLGLGTGAGAGAGLGSGAGDILATLLRLKGIGGPGTAKALRYGGGALGAGLGGAVGYNMGKSHEKDSSYHPRLLLSSLTNAIREGGQRTLPHSFPAGV